MNRYTLSCSAGHEITTAEHLSRCPVYVKGKPCVGEVRVVGRKAKGAEKETMAK